MLDNSKGKRHVLFLCTGNSVRSQMAEGFLRVLGGNQFMVKSAGTNPAGVNPRSVEVMKEESIDISNQSSNKLTADMLEWADLLITLCGDAHENCPVVPHGVEKRHWSLSDPSKGGGTEEEIMERFRETRDLIKGYVKELVGR